MVEIKVINKSTNHLPQFSTEHSAGVDLRAYLKDSIVLKNKVLDLVFYILN